MARYLLVKCINGTFVDLNIDKGIVSLEERDRKPYFMVRTPGPLDYAITEASFRSLRQMIYEEE